MNAQCIDLVFQIRNSWKRRVEFVQCILKIGGEGDILQRTETGNVELGYIDVSERIDFVDGRNCTLNRRIGTADIVLD